MRRTFACAALALFCGCVGAEPGDQGSLGSSSEAIIGGTRERGMREVVVVASVDSGGSILGLCSGTAIGTRYVLTAKHCVFRELSDGSFVAIAASSLRIIVGHDVTSGSGIEYSRGVNAIFTTPGVFSDADLSSGADIAVVRASSDIGVPIRQLARAQPRPTNPLTIVGFGRTSASSGASGVKYRGSAHVSVVYRGVFESEGSSWTCQGDSGGPAFDAVGRITGITSFGTDRSCATDTSYYTEVAQHIALVAEWIGRDPPCGVSAEECNGADDDCNGVVDDGCTIIGGRCYGDAECASGLCRAVADGEAYCVQACEPASDDPGCPSGYVCEATGCNVGDCVTGSPGPRALDADCTEDSQCVTNFCYEALDGSHYCARQCQEGGAPCTEGRICVTDGFPCGACEVPEPGMLLPFGSACTADSECDSGLCRGGSCTRPCASDDECTGDFRCGGEYCVRGTPVPPGGACGDPMECVDTAPMCVAVDGDMICAAPCDGSGGCAVGTVCEDGLCLLPGLGLGDPCTANPECRSGLCAGTCTRVCDDTSPCPEGFECRPAGPVSGCFPLAPPPPDEGGCSVTSGQERDGALPSLFVLALALLGAWGRTSRIKLRSRTPRNHTRVIRGRTSRIK